MMFVYQGKPVYAGSTVEISGINYSYEWFCHATPGQLELLDVSKVPDPVMPDENFYVVSKTLNASFQYDKTPRDLGEVKAILHSQIRAAAHSLLAPTDWYVIRSIEEPGTTPADVTTYRKAIRTRSSEIDAAINACKDVPALQALVTADLNWPLTAEEKARRDRETTPA